MDFKEVEALLFSLKDIKRVLSNDESKQTNRTEKYLSRVLARFVTTEWQVIKMVLNHIKYMYTKII